MITRHRILFFLLAATAASFLLSLFFLQVFTAGLIAFWLFEPWSEKKKHQEAVSRMFIFFLASRLLSVALSEYPVISLQVFYKEILFYFGFFALTFYLTRLSNAEIDRLTTVFTVAGASAALLGVILYAFHFVQRAQTFTSGYSTFSSYLVTVLAVSLSFYSTARENGKVLLWSGAVTLIIVGIITSLGRTNIFIAILLCIASIFLFKIKMKDALIVAVLVAAISLAFYKGLNEQGMADRIERPGFLSDRDIIYKGAAALALRHPVFGFGPRTFETIFPYKEEFADKQIGSWHNDFLQIYFDSGILGLTAFAALLAAALRTGFRTLKQKVLNPRMQDIMGGFVLALIGLVLSSLTAGFITSPVLSVVFAFLAAMTISIAHPIDS